MVSGSYDGPIYVFHADKKGGFLEPVTLNGPDGQTLQLDQATSVAVLDWDKNGVPDLISGSISGPVWYLPNVKDGKAGTPVRLSSKGGEISAPDGGPAVVDWDGDGVLDLFLGQDSGRLQFYKGVNGATPSFEAPVDVLPELTPAESEPRRAVPGKSLDWDIRRPGMRPKPSVCDWDGDGKLDLLVGDVCLAEGSTEHLSPEKLKVFQGLRAEQDTLKARAVRFNKDLNERTFKELGWSADRKLTPEDAAKFSEVYDRLYRAHSEALATDKRLLEIYEQMSPLMPAIDYHGFVWVLLRK